MYIFLFIFYFHLIFFIYCILYTIIIYITIWITYFFFHLFPHVLNTKKCRQSLFGRFEHTFLILKRFNQLLKNNRICIRIIEKVISTLTASKNNENRYYSTKFFDDRFELQKQKLVIIMWNSIRLKDANWKVWSFSGKVQWSIYGDLDTFPVFYITWDMDEIWIHFPIVFK